ncbi:hypothetical protein HPB51_011322 [Rhipicephalus microplus]|uniref:Uncharacterized protein n=1 Tax=Rhipicephalus microplus TaxID=6941 RepID=A0A9J6DMR9_RHIMP|nr:hypothetical protein HPB51_011322 [Rhipicephalus microplus]
MPSPISSGTSSWLLPFLNASYQYMVILFLLFVVQFSVACACLAMTEDQERELASQGWKKASPAVRAQAERIFRCCGFERNASDPTAELQCEHVPTCCPPQEVSCLLPSFLLKGI